MTNAMPIMAAQRIQALISFNFAKICWFLSIYLFNKKVQDLICWLDISLDMQTEESEEMLIWILLIFPNFFLFSMFKAKASKAFNVSKIYREIYLVLILIYWYYEID